MTAWITGWPVLDQSEGAGLCNRKCRKDGCKTLFNVPESPDSILKNELAAGKYRRQKAIHDNRFYCETHRCWECENPKKAGQELCSTHCPKCKYTGCGVFIDDPAKFCANHGCSEEECRNEAMGGYRTCSSHTPKCPLGIVKCNRYQPLGDGSVYCRLRTNPSTLCLHRPLIRTQMSVDTKDATGLSWLIQIEKNRNGCWVSAKGIMMTRSGRITVEVDGDDCRQFVFHCPSFS